MCYNLNMNKSILKHFYFTIISFIVCLAIILSISVFKNDNSSCSNVKNYSSLTYTALGDSITRGSYNKVQMENPYPILVGKELNFANTINLGVSGYTFCENGKWGSINEINAAIKEVANLHNILVLDTYSLSNFESEMNNTELSDGCHPTPEFHKNNLTPLVVEFIKNNYHF